MRKGFLSERCRFLHKFIGRYDTRSWDISQPERYGAQDIGLAVERLAECVDLCGRYLIVKLPLPILFNKLPGYVKGGIARLVMEQRRIMGRAMRYSLNVTL